MASSCVLNYGSNVIGNISHVSNLVSVLLVVISHFKWVCIFGVPVPCGLSIPHLKFGLKTQ